MPSLDAPDPRLFQTRGDPTDPRMGDLVLRGVDDIPESVRVALIGAPQDIGVVRNGGRPGSAAGPDAIRAMFYRLTPYDVAGDHSIPSGYVVDLGDVNCQGELEEIHDRVEEVVLELRARDLFPIVLGGGHDIAYPAARGGLGSGTGGGLVNVDAHLDVRQPNPHRNSGTSLRMLVEEGTVDGARLVEFGIQSHANAQAHARWLAGAGGTILTLDESRARGFPRTFALALEIATSGGRSAHGSLDIDSVVGSSAPGVSAPMPDGLAAGEFLAAARSMGRHPSLVSIDIAELNPLLDCDNRTARLAARALMEILVGHLSRDQG